MTRPFRTITPRDTTVDHQTNCGSSSSSPSPPSDTLWTTERYIPTHCQCDGSMDAWMDERRKRGLRLSAHNEPVRGTSARVNPVHTDTVGSIRCSAKKHREVIEIDAEKRNSFEPEKFRCLFRNTRLACLTSSRVRTPSRVFIETAH